MAVIEYLLDIQTYSIHSADCMASSDTPAGCTNFCSQERTWATNIDCVNFANCHGLNPMDCVGTVSPNWCNWRSTATEVIGDFIGNDDGICNLGAGECCRGIRECCVDGGDGWWKSDPNTCYMRGGLGNVFEPDCHHNVTDKLNAPGTVFLPACTNPGETAVSSMQQIAPQLVKQDNTKVIILNYHIQDNSITLLDAQILFNDPPNHFNEDGRFLVRGLSITGEMIEEIVLDDPREFMFTEQQDFEPGMMMKDSVDFTVVALLTENLRIIEIIDLETQETLTVTEINEQIRDFCSLINNDDPLCQTLDSDGDGIVDQDDSCPISSLEPMVTIDGCNPNVDNVLVNNGCTMNDFIAQCADGAKNHGQFVSCIAHLTNDWKKAGLISGQEKGKIQKCAAQVDIP